MSTTAAKVHKQKCQPQLVKPIKPLLPPVRVGTSSVNTAGAKLAEYLVEGLLGRREEKEKAILKSEVMIQVYLLIYI